MSGQMQVSLVGKIALPKEFWPVHYMILFFSPRESETSVHLSYKKTSMAVFFLFLIFCLVLTLLKFLVCVFLVSHFKFLTKNNQDIHRKTVKTLYQAETWRQ